mmetsp:Transcript_42679/g.52513  ORF Transcript_42679/g.52513 Transcript_42679/m.52513 type:complete len:197 (-) Transcript_42679:164-754(-)
MCRGDCFASKSTSLFIHVINTIALGFYIFSVIVFQSKCGKDCYGSDALGHWFWIFLVGSPGLMYIFGYITGILSKRKGINGDITCLSLYMIILMILLTLTWGLNIWNFLELLFNKHVGVSKIYTIMALINCLYPAFLLFILRGIYKAKGFSKNQGMLDKDINDDNQGQYIDMNKNSDYPLENMNENTNTNKKWFEE